MEYILPSFSQDDIYKLHKLEESPSREVEVTREDLLSYYRDMAIIREMETQSTQLYGQKKIRGFLHVYSGQVGVPSELSAMADWKLSCLHFEEC